MVAIANASDFHEFVLCVVYEDWLDKYAVHMAEKPQMAKQNQVIEFTGNSDRGALTKHRLLDTSILIINFFLRLFASIEQSYKLNFRFSGILFLKFQ